MELDSVQIGAADVETAAAAYRLLLGLDSALLGGVHRFQLAHGAIEIELGEPGVRSIRFVGQPPPGWPDSFHGLTVRAGSPAGVLSGTDGLAIDHIVVRTPDPDRAIRLWRDRVGLRLALDRTFPDRGLRLVFFRSAGMTLEFAGADPPPADRSEPDQLWGVSYRVPDLAARRERLRAAGVDVSPVRPGMRPGTSVVTVRSGTAGVPTLLLGVDR